jgi:guanylate kinase
MLTLSLLLADAERYAPRRGLMVILSSPSGAGKSSTARRILSADSQIVSSVSATTRPMRPGEVDGKDYFFIQRYDFEQRIQDQAFFEHAEVFGNLYGTPKAPVMEALAGGKDVIFDVDWQGAEQLRDAAPDDVVSIFLLPPSIDDLRVRLRARNQDNSETVQRRMQGAHGEISHWEDYEYVLINRDLDETVSAVQAIIAAERLKRCRQPGLPVFAGELLSEPLS